MQTDPNLSSHVFYLILYEVSKISAEMFLPSLSMYIQSSREVQYLWNDKKTWPSLIVKYRFEYNTGDYINNAETTYLST